MRNFIVLVCMVLCLFGPSVVFAFVGYSAIETAGKRPGNSAKVMTTLLTKLIITTAVLIGCLAVLLKLFG